MAASIPAIENALRTSAFRSRSLSFHRLLYDLLELHTKSCAFILKCALNQNGQFKCPNAGAKQTTAIPLAPKKKSATKPIDPLAAVVKNLKSRSKGKPQKVKTLIADIKSQKLGLSDREILDLIETLRTQGTLVLDGTKVTYNL